MLAVDDASSDGAADVVRSIRDARITLVERHAVLGEARCLNLSLEPMREEQLDRQSAITSTRGRTPRPSVDYS